MNSEVSKPIIGITMGDAAGIGAEIILKALANEDIRELCKPLIIGDLSFLQRTAESLDLSIIISSYGAKTSEDSANIEVFDLENLPHKITIGMDSGTTGKASAEYIETAVRLWKNNEINAIATAPISKKAISMGGYEFPGHTEFLAHLTNTQKFAMSFFAEKLRVVLLSTHIPIREAIENVKKDKLVELIRFSHQEISRLLKRDVKIAVAGLNPHASEGGMFGTEEADEIIPAIEECRDQFGIDISGPFSPDTIFLRGFKGEFDCVISCYHDQATIAVKCLSFGASVNVTLGLPLIRTSVDHGTAYDIAGKNVADESSMNASIRLAAELVLNSEKF